MPEQETEQLVIALATDITKIRNDLVQFPITYYFHEIDLQSAFPGALPLAMDIANRANRPGVRSTRKGCRYRASGGHSRPVGASWRMVP